MDEHRRTQNARLDAMLRATDPLACGSLDGDRLDRALDAIGAAIVARSVRRVPGRRTRWFATRRGILAIGAAVLVAGGGAAAARLFINAHTGIHPTKAWEIKAGGPGEALNLAGTNFRQVALRVASGIPYPAGDAAWRNWVITVADPSANRSCPAGSPRGCTMTVSAGALRGGFASSAFCAWVYDWRQARLNGDALSAERAARVIDEAPSWKAVVALDPHPSASPPYTNPRRHGQMTIFGWLLPFRSAVLKGDVSLVNLLLAANYGGGGCGYERPPAGSHDGTIIPSRTQSR
jgi:hypothetical protein